MTDETTPINSEDGGAAQDAPGDRAVQDAGRDRGRARRSRRRMPEPVEAAAFGLEERVVWPLQDRLSLPGSNSKRTLFGGALAIVVAGAVAAALSGGGSAPSTTTVAATPPPQREPLVDTSTAPPPPAQSHPTAPTLHGAKPVFSPPSPASMGGEKTGDSGAAADNPATGSASSGTAASSPPSGSTATDSSPAAATISSDPSSSSSGAAEPAGSGEGATSSDTAAARAAAPDGPPAGPAALKVAREFAQGFVVYETGGDKADYKPAFETAATPQLIKALLQRPPRQPAGVKVPRAKVLNVVAGPSEGTVYKVSVSLLRVGVTSELRLDMEKLKNAEWRVTNVLG